MSWESVGPEVPSSRPRGEKAGGYGRNSPGEVRRRCCAWQESEGYFRLLSLR